MFPTFKIPNTVWLGIFFLGLLGLFLSGHFLTILQGFVAIILHPSLLITDYLAIGGLQATLINAWIMLHLSLLTLKLSRAKFSGVAFAGILTIVGFSFFGKNPINVIPIWIGFYFYTRLTKSKLNQYVGTFLFSSGIAPVVSYLMFGQLFNLGWAIPIALLVGLFVGFLTPMVVSTVGKFHQGYNLYNTGFGLGFIAMLITAILKTFSFPVEVPTTTTTEYHWFLFGLIGVISLILIIVMYVIDRTILRKWVMLLREPGNLPSDFIKSNGMLVTLFNIGTIGIFSLLTLLTFNLQISGPMMAAILTFMGFGAYGKHIQNALPVMTGVVLASSLPNLSLTLLGPSIGIFFVTAIAPIAGKYGFVYGVIAGFLHLILKPYALQAQGGFDLYNNGFTAGLVAGLIVVLAQQFPLRFPTLFQPRKRH